MNKKRSVKLIREGRFLAEVTVELVEDETGWSPYLSIQDVKKLEAVRSALKFGKLQEASTLASIYEITPVAEAAQ